MYYCNGKVEFSAVITLVWSFRNHSNMLISVFFIIIYINVENSCAA